MWWTYYTFRASWTRTRPGEGLGDGAGEIVVDLMGFKPPVYIYYNIYIYIPL
jgi:hypothetical protein